MTRRSFFGTLAAALGALAFWRRRGGPRVYNLSLRETPSGTYMQYLGIDRPTAPNFWDTIPYRDRVFLHGQQWERWDPVIEDWKP